MIPGPTACSCRYEPDSVTAPQRIYTCNACRRSREAGLPHLTVVSNAIRPRDRLYTVEHPPMFDTLTFPPRNRQERRKAAAQKRRKPSKRRRRR